MKKVFCIVLLVVFICWGGISVFADPYVVPDESPKIVI